MLADWSALGQGIFEPVAVLVGGGIWAILHDLVGYVPFRLRNKELELQSYSYLCIVVVLTIRVSLDQLCGKGILLDTNLLGTSAPQVAINQSSTATFPVSGYRLLGQDSQLDVHAQ